MTELIYGRNAVKSILQSTDSLPQELFILQTINDDSFVLAAKEKRIVYHLVTRGELDKMVKGANHQGIIARVNSFSYSSLNELIGFGEKTDNSIILVLDGLEDPQNFGSIIRSCDAFGVTGIIIGTHRQVDVNSTVIKVATGAQNFVPITKVNNISQALEMLKKKNYWIVASDGSGNEDFSTINYRGKTALIIGSEGKGVSSLVLKNADHVAKIPMVGHVNSLNAAVATACFLSMINFLNNKK